MKNFKCTFIPEASAICRVGEKLIIAGDEDKKALFIISNKGKVKKAKIKGGKWDDMESLAALSKSSFYGITSHSVTKKGKRKSEREQLIRFSIKGHKIKAKECSSLRDDILKYLDRVASGAVDIKKASKAVANKGGLNIEGLAVIKDKLFIGLRSPLTKKGEAIIIELTGGKITAWRAVDLKGKGIRDLATASKRLLILAGSTDDTDDDFGVYEISSLGKVTPKRYKKFTELKRPEGIFPEADGSLTVVQDFEEEKLQHFMVRLEPLKKK